MLLYKENTIKFKTLYNVFYKENTINFKTLYNVFYTMFWYCLFPGNCAQGYYCDSGVDMQHPNGSNTGNGNICPVGHFCPDGSATYTPCENGTYANNPGHAVCTLCEEGG